MCLVAPEALVPMAKLDPLESPDRTVVLEPPAPLGAEDSLASWASLDPRDPLVRLVSPESEEWPVTWGLLEPLEKTEMLVPQDPLALPEVLERKERVV